uniref:Uncharacterized protein n=1 Tax=Trichogramma kaykai TaxID=54128 RepID=A0ABD2WCX7_9HYME
MYANIAVIVAKYTSVLNRSDCAAYSISFSASLRQIGVISRVVVQRQLSCHVRDWTLSSCALAKMHSLPVTPAHTAPDRLERRH